MAKSTTDEAKAQQLQPTAAGKTDFQRSSQRTITSNNDDNFSQTGRVPDYLFDDTDSDRLNHHSDPIWPVKNNTRSYRTRQPVRMDDRTLRRLRRERIREHNNGRVRGGDGGKAPRASRKVDGDLSRKATREGPALSSRLTKSTATRHKLTLEQSQEKLTQSGVKALLHSERGRMTRETTSLRSTARAARKRVVDISATDVPAPLPSSTASTTVQAIQDDESDREGQLRPGATVHGRSPPSDTLPTLAIATSARGTRLTTTIVPNDYLEMEQLKSHSGHIRSPSSPETDSFGSIRRSQEMDDRTSRRLRREARRRAQDETRGENSAAKAHRGVEREQVQHAKRGGPDISSRIAKSMATRNKITLEESRQRLKRSDVQNAPQPVRIKHKGSRSAAASKSTKVIDMNQAKSGSSASQPKIVPPQSPSTRAAQHSTGEDAGHLTFSTSQMLVGQPQVPRALSRKRPVRSTPYPTRASLRRQIPTTEDEPSTLAQNRLFRDGGSIQPGPIRSGKRVTRVERIDSSASKTDHTTLEEREQGQQVESSSPQGHNCDSQSNHIDAGAGSHNAERHRFRTLRKTTQAVREASLKAAASRILQKQKAANRRSNKMKQSERAKSRGLSMSSATRKHRHGQTSQPVSDDGEVQPANLAIHTTDDARNGVNLDDSLTSEGQRSTSELLGSYADHTTAITTVLTALRGQYPVLAGPAWNYLSDLSVSGDETDTGLAGVDRDLKKSADSRENRSYIPQTATLDPIDQPPLAPADPKHQMNLEDEASHPIKLTSPQASGPMTAIGCSSRYDGKVNQNREAVESPPTWRRQSEETIPISSPEAKETGPQNGCTIQGRDGHPRISKVANQVQGSRITKSSLKKTSRWERDRGKKKSVHFAEKVLFDPYQTSEGRGRDRPLQGKSATVSLGEDQPPITDREVTELFDDEQASIVPSYPDLTIFDQDRLIPQANQIEQVQKDRPCLSSSNIREHGQAGDAMSPCASIEDVEMVDVDSETIVNAAMRDPTQRSGSNPTELLHEGSSRSPTAENGLSQRKLGLRNTDQGSIMKRSDVTSQNLHSGSDPESQTDMAVACTKVELQPATIDKPNYRLQLCTLPNPSLEAAQGSLSKSVKAELGSDPSTTEATKFPTMITSTSSHELSEGRSNMEALHKQNDFRCSQDVFSQVDRLEETVLPDTTRLTTPQAGQKKAKCINSGAPTEGGLQERRSPVDDHKVKPRDRRSHDDLRSDSDEDQVASMLTSRRMKPRSRLYSRRIVRSKDDDKCNTNADNSDSDQNLVRFTSANEFVSDEMAKCHRIVEDQSVTTRHLARSSGTHEARINPSGIHTPSERSKKSQARKPISPRLSSRWSQASASDTDTFATQSARVSRSVRNPVESPPQQLQRTIASSTSRRAESYPASVHRVLKASVGLDKAKSTPATTTSPRISSHRYGTKHRSEYTSGESVQSRPRGHRDEHASSILVERVRYDRKDKDPRRVSVPTHGVLPLYQQLKQESPLIGHCTQREVSKMNPVRPLQLWEAGIGYVGEINFRTFSTRAPLKQIIYNEGNYVWRLRTGADADRVRRRQRPSHQGELFQWSIRLDDLIIEGKKYRASDVTILRIVEDEAQRRCLILARLDDGHHSLELCGWSTMLGRVLSPRHHLQRLLNQWRAQASRKSQSGANNATNVE